MYDVYVLQSFFCAEGVVYLISKIVLNKAKALLQKVEGPF